MAAFQIPRTPHTTNKTIRFPDDVIADDVADFVGNDFIAAEEYVQCGR